MKTLNFKEKDFFNEIDDTFIKIPAQTISFEHSLISVSKWEAIWKIPYISDTQKTSEQASDYIKCMSINKNDGMFIHAMTAEQALELKEYIDDPMTATTVFNSKKAPAKKSPMTSEVIYATMIELGIPIEFEKWHLNRLLILIQVLQARQSPQKMSRADILRQNSEWNKLRKSKLHSRG